jgi:hypothetical protein
VKSVIERLLPHRQWVQWTGHAGLAALAYLLAFYIHGEDSMARAQWTLVLGTLPLLLRIRLATFAGFHLFGGLWRYVSMRDMWIAECGMDDRAASRDVEQERTKVGGYEGTASIRNTECGGWRERTG